MTLLQPSHPSLARELVFKFTSKCRDMHDMHDMQSATSLAKLLGPIVKLLQSLLVHAGSNSLQAGLKVLQRDGSDLVRFSKQQLIAQTPQRSHGSIFRQSRDIGARKS